MLRRRWLAFRNRRLANPAFRRAAERSWLTRWLARRNARALFDIVGGFTYSQVLASCIELDLFTTLRDGPLSVPDIAAETTLDVDAAADLLRAGASLGLFEPVGSAEFALGPLGAVMVDNEAVVAMVRHHATFYRDLSDPVALLRRGRGAEGLAAFWPYAGSDETMPAAAPGDVTEYSQLMAASQPMVSAEILDAHRFSAHRRLLDVGGGTGAFARAVAALHPELEVALFDLPPVVELARRAAARGLPTVDLHAGDFRTDPLPEGFDLITLVRIVHDHPDGVVQQLLERVHSALPRGGTVLIAEPMAATPGAERFTAAYFTFYLRAMGSGRPRTPAEIAALLEASGFVDVQQKPVAVPMIASVITARKSDA